MHSLTVGFTLFKREVPPAGNLPARSHKADLYPNREAASVAIVAAGAKVALVSSCSASGLTTAPARHTAAHPAIGTTCSMEPAASAVMATGARGHDHIDMLARCGWLESREMRSAARVARCSCVRESRRARVAAGVLLAHERAARMQWCRAEVGMAGGGRARKGRAVTVWDRYSRRK